MRLPTVGDLLAALAGVALLAKVTLAQVAPTELRIRIESGPNAPIPGALVAVLDGDRVLSEGLSTARGTSILTAPPGIYRVSVRRIGFRPFVSEPVTLPFAGELLLTVQTDRVMLEAMVVSATARCGPVTRDAETLSAVWDEISKALRSSQLTLADLAGMGIMRTYRREVGIYGNILANDTAVKKITNGRPFGAINPDALATLGYLRGSASSGWEYFGPDEAVLLSTSFAETHCFKVVRDHRKRAGQIGVAFEPAPNHRQSDIKGVLWVDEKTAELDDVRFTFVNAGVLSRFEPGGFTRFHRAPSGAWVVNEWQLRMPRVELRVGAQRELVVSSYVENGGWIGNDDSPSQPMKPKH